MPGVAWLREDNVVESVRRARAGGAQVVICDPQWGGGAEYHSDLKAGQVAELAWFDEAGCDHVIGAGTHLAGPMLLRRAAAGTGGIGGTNAVGGVVARGGNLVFGPGWWEQTPEGGVMPLAFPGTPLVNVHPRPYLMLF